MRGGRNTINMARITFVYPDFESIGVEYLMAVCRKAGHDVDFVYYEAEDNYLARTKNVNYKNIAARISHTNPHIAAFSCVTDNYQSQLHCAESLKEQQKQICTIFGGIHPTALPEKTLQNEAIDAVAVGEAENSLLEFLKASESETRFLFPDDPIPGIIFKKSGRIIGNPIEGKLANLDFLPFPYKTPFLSALRESLYAYRIMTSRGCPYHCSYCFNSFMPKLRRNTLSVRQRSVSNVIEELRLAKNERSVKYILFVDDSFTSDKKWIMDFCKRYRAEIHLPFACITNPHYIDEEIVEALARAGAVNVQLGVQTLSEALCSQILDRKSSNRKIMEVIHLFKRYDIMVQVDHMLGIPGDTMENQEECAYFYNNHRPDLISIVWLTYYPKTPIVDMAQKRGILTEHDIQNIERGIRLTKESFLTGGSMRNPGPYYSISFLLNWLPLLPSWMVTCLLKSRIYRLFRIKNYFLSTALPRISQSLLNKRDFRGRSHILRFIHKLLSIDSGQPEKTKTHGKPGL